jgi:hypothetical protein
MHKKGGPDMDRLFCAPCISRLADALYTRRRQHQLHNAIHNQHENNRKYDAADNEVGKLAVLEITLTVFLRLYAEGAGDQAAHETEYRNTFFLLILFGHGIHQ